VSLLSIDVFTRNESFILEQYLNANGSIILKWRE